MTAETSGTTFRIRVHILREPKRRALWRGAKRRPRAKLILGTLKSGMQSGKVGSNATLLCQLPPGDQQKRET